MKGLRTVLLPLLVAGIALPLAAQTAPPLPPLLQGDGALHPGWRFVGFPKQKADLPPTRFEAGRVEGVPAVQVITRSSYGTLVHDGAGTVPARLQWRWRLDEPLTGGTTPPDILTKAGDDAALKVCVMFDHPLDRVPFVERTLLRIVGPGFTRARVRFISLQGGGAPLKRWASESRDVARDFIELFADELPEGRATPTRAAPPVTRVLLGADSDNTASTSSGWVADLRWASGAP